MAGLGSRFWNVGYTMPKPLIKVNQQPIIQLAVENLNLDANYIYVVKKEHRDKYDLDAILNNITPGCTIIETDGLTDGQVCTALLAKQYIDNEDPIFFANSDQFVEWDSKRFMNKMKKEIVDGGIVTFKSNKRHFGYVKTNEDGFVEKVAKNNPISDDANTGYYYWKHGSEFVKYAEQMVSKNISYNNEFFIHNVV